MKKIVIIVIIIVGIVVLLFTNTYTSSPGFVSPEDYKEFDENKSVCYGLDILLNKQATYADAPGTSFCIGFLKI